MAQFVPEQANELPAPGRRNAAPARKGLGGGASAGEVRIADRDPADLAPIDGRVADQRTPGPHSKLAKDIRCFGGWGHADSSLARAIAATPASIVSSFLPKQRRTRWRGGSRSANADSGTTATPARSTAAVAKASSSAAIPDAIKSTHRKYVDVVSRAL